MSLHTFDALNLATLLFFSND